MAVAFNELANSPRISFDEQGMSATRELICAWDDALDVVRAFMGTRTPFGTAAMAAFPGFASCLAAGANLEPFSPDLSPEQVPVGLDVAATYGTKPAKVTISFKTKPYSSDAPREDMPEIEAGTFLSYRQRIGSTITTVPGRGLRWLDDSDNTKPVPPDVNAGVREPVVEHVMSWHKVVRPPWGAIRRLAGLLNEELFVGATPETLMFMGGEAGIEYEIDPDQPATWRLDYTFREKCVKKYNPDDNTTTFYGWNHFFRDSDGKYAKLCPSYLWDQGIGILPVGDFRTLFKYET